MPLICCFEHRIIIRDFYNPARIGTVLFVLQVNEEIFDRMSCFQAG